MLYNVSLGQCYKGCYLPITFEILNIMFPNFEGVMTKCLGIVKNEFY